MSGAIVTILMRMKLPHLWMLLLILRNYKSVFQLTDIQETSILTWYFERRNSRKTLAGLNGVITVAAPLPILVLAISFALR